MNRSSADKLIQRLLKILEGLIKIAILGGLDHTSLHVVFQDRVSSKAECKAKAPLINTMQRYNYLRVSFVENNPCFGGE